MTDWGPIPEFQRTQYQFAAHLRDPEHCSPPQANKSQPIEERRLGIYRELVYNNIHTFISSGFPVLCGILGVESVNRLVRQFIVDYRCHSPYFLEISQEFLHFLQEQYQLTESDPAFLLELAHYEWVELALDVSEQSLPAQEAAGDALTGQALLEAHFMVSPLAWSLSYTYPVHRIGPEFQPTATPTWTPEQGTFLVVYRNRQEQVGFLEINAVTARLLQLLDDKVHTGASAMQLIAEELDHPDPAQLVEFGKPILAELQAREIILLSAAALAEA